MALDYPGFRELAERLIDENGRDITLVHIDRGNPADPAKPWRASTNASEINLAAKGVFVEYKNEDFDGSLIRRGDKRVLVAAKPVEDAMPAETKIETYDALIDGSVRWKVIQVDVIEPGPSRILYEIQARK